MTTSSAALRETAQPTNRLDTKLGAGPGRIGVALFGIVMAVGLGYAGLQLLRDLANVHVGSIVPFVMLGIALKRIVVTVGERIGKDHLTYAQGAAAELTAMATIGAADAFGLPVSTTHVLSSGVAGTMWANKSGLQWGTVRNLLLAWVLTLPVSILLSGTLFWIFSHIGG
jgi:phosphate/sulfate permease